MRTWVLMDDLQKNLKWCDITSDMHRDVYSKPFTEII